jgi:phosphate transport system permease protein
MDRRVHELKDRSFILLGLGAITFAFAILIVLIINTFVDGVSFLSWQFLVGFPSRNPQIAGILPALIGSAYLMLFVIIFAFPLGVGAAIYLEEYAKKNWLVNLIEINIANLAGVPSIVYGILGLEVFVRALGFGRSILSGGLTLSLLVLPIVVISAREAIRAVPFSLKEASYALGATKWQMIYHTLLPAALPGILTGTILAISRAIGEAAPLIVVGAVAFTSFLPTSPLDSFTALPIQIFNWVSYPQKEFHKLASAGVIVLLILTLLINASAIFLRRYFRKKIGR